MREQVDEARTRARRLLHLSQEIIRFKRRFDDESSRLRTSLDQQQIDGESLTRAFDELRQRLLRHAESQQVNRGGVFPADLRVLLEKLALFRADLSLVDEHLRDYALSSTDGASLLNLQGYLQSIRVNLTSLTQQ